MNSRDGRRRRVLTQDERVLWTTVTKSIEPMRAYAPVEAGQSEPTSAVSRPVQAPKRTAKPSAVAPPAPPPMPAQLGRRMKQRVARGKEAIDGRLDLHGLTQAQAHSALLHFLRSASARGARFVLVITGKGTGSQGQGERGVLRRQVPQWLGLPEFRVFVVGFEDAHIAHGGEGALYVRLRKTRDG
jgi:DNA-nicking Smr family endonuclease